MKYRISELFDWNLIAILSIPSVLGLKFLNFIAKLGQEIILDEISEVSFKNFRND